MAERLTPGVYIEERPGGVRPIQGAATSTAGFVGEAERGIPDRATFVRSFADFQRLFGGHRRGDLGHLAAAIQAFFEAGGRRGYVVRVLPGDARTGSTLPVAAGALDPWGRRRDVLRIRAKGNGAWASALRVHVERPTTTGPAFRLRLEWVENGRARTVETWDDVRMDAEHPDYAATVVTEGSQYIEVEDLFRRDFLDAEERVEAPLPEEVAVLGTREPTGAGGRFAVPRQAVLEFRWRDSVGQVGSPGSEAGRGVPVVFDDPNTPGQPQGDDVLMTPDEFAQWLTQRLGDRFRVTRPATPAQIRAVTDGPWNTTGGNQSVISLDGANHNVTYAVRTAASLDLGAGPFGLNDGDVLDLVVGGVRQQHALEAGEVTPGAATAQEVVAVLNTRFTGIQALVDGTAQVRTDARGPGATLSLEGATAAVLGAPPAATGTGNVADPGAVTPAELSAIVNGLGLPLRAEVDGARVVVRLTDTAPHVLDWVSDPGPADILAGTPAVNSPVPGSALSVQPAVASRAYLVTTFAGTTLDLSQAQTIRVTATSGALSRDFDVNAAAMPNNATVALAALADAINAAVAAAEQNEADRFLVEADAAGPHLVLTAPARRDGVNLRLTATGAAPWPAAPVPRDGAGGTVVEDQRAVEITVSEEIQPGVARALPRLFSGARAAGRAENDPAGPAVQPALTGDAPLRVVGGTDGTGRPGLTEFTGALAAFDRVDLGLLAAPGRTDGGYVSALSAYCDAHDVFYVADGPGGVARDFEISADDARRHVEALPARSRNAGMFYPWVEVADPVGIGRDPRRFVPPSGHISGVFARTDLTRGVWKAPAGVEARVSGAIGLQQDLVDADQDLLNPIGLNCLRQFPAAGIVSWGSRTLASEADPEWRYVPVRRTALFLKKSLRDGLQWAVFEPNDEDLWIQIELAVTSFMLGLFRQGAFQGTTPDEAFLVQCDRDTNPQELIDQGIVTTRVAFAPLKPAEFVVVELSQKSLVTV